MIQAQQSLKQKIFWKELEDAADIPQEADLLFLCQMLDQAIALVPEHLRLAVAGEAFVQLANIYASRASSLLDAWEQSHNSLGPVLTAESLAALLVRQSLQLDLSDLVQLPEHKYVRSEEPHLATVDSIAGQVDKNALLKVLAEQQSEYAVDDETAKAKALDVAHNENVSAWVEVIALWLQQNSCSQTVPLVKLQQGLGMPMVEVWLGLLLGGRYKLQQLGEFYEPMGIFVVKQDAVECA